ncbi:WRKY domain-containing protein [Heracleum sosnowskyi]|uniref:WRKY domain-containing protein n=1 Tax=Heracleum sosnowskyi TaxID=360622 RepID=A0AAD8HN41_9APIA|nr:WRKY domain-containing protein [Heracleum sosnowskyi]
MDKYQGDLADIIRASGGTISETLGSTPMTSGGTMTDSWQFQMDPLSFDDLGHPFSSLRDPVLFPLDQIDMSGGSSSFFSNSNNLQSDITAGFCGGTGNSFIGNLDHQHQEIKKSNNHLSKMHQISQDNTNLSCGDSQSFVASPRLLKVPSSTLISSNGRMVSANSSRPANNCLIKSTCLQISSPRSTSIKRRKSQAKKVVCVPAPTPANSKPTGEIVPSDLWAWRKYGQKPIKGSPYPRGYYRCSSSKGCSARKQVERSRTDSNMLVITYTSEHNHPWPTQRNALAGSTRNQHASKTTNPTSKTLPTADSQYQNSLDLSIFKEEKKEDNDIGEIKCTSITSNDVIDKSADKRLTEMEDSDQFSKGFTPFESCRPAFLRDSINHIPDQDFFSDLAELEFD